MRRIQHTTLVVPLIAVLIAGCGTATVTPAPTASTAAPTNTPTVPATAPPASATPSSTPSASDQPADPFLGALIVTVSDRLRVRSAPEVSDTSVKYEPLLPLGTELRVVGGPVRASGYVWYDVTPVAFALAGGIVHGWVASAGHDGAPWLALADRPIVGLETAASSVERAATDPAAARAIAGSVTAFGFDLYRQLLADPALHLATSNMVFSPTSIALALGMVRAGARNDTAAQIDTVLHSEGWDQVGIGLNSLEQALSSRDGAYLDDQGAAHPLALRIANASFAQRGWSIEPAYLDAVASAFGAGLKLVDYATDPEAARQAINAWVREKTAGRIPELLDPLAVSPMTRLYLVNAIYLKANWVVEFAKDLTAPGSFTRLDGTTVGVPTMHLDGGQEVPYVHGDGWRATELRYRGSDGSTPLAMTLVMPDDLRAFEAGLSPGRLDRIASSLTAERTRLHEAVEFGSDGGTCGTYPYSLALAMPRFKVGTRAQLKQVLAALGMPLSFDEGRADVTGIHVPALDEGPIHIGNVIHQANLDVDELGTEAAAATAIGMDTAGCGAPAPARTLTLRLDHPFLFALRDVDTGAVLFLGRVVDPSDVG